MILIKDKNTNEIMPIHMLITFAIFIVRYSIKVVKKIYIVLLTLCCAKLNIVDKYFKPYEMQLMQS